MLVLTDTAMTTSNKDYDLHDFFYNLRFLRGRDRGSITFLILVSFDLNPPFILYPFSIQHRSPKIPIVQSST